MIVILTGVLGIIFMLLMLASFAFGLSYLRHNDDRRLRWAKLLFDVAVFVIGPLVSISSVIACIMMLRGDA